MEKFISFEKLSKKKQRELNNHRDGHGKARTMQPAAYGTFLHLESFFSAQ